MEEVQLATLLRLFISPNESSRMSGMMVKAA